MTSIPYRKYTLVGDKEVLTYELWSLEGKSHRVDGPALRKWTVVNGLPVLTLEDWWVEGKRRRVDEPAWQKWQIVNGLPVLTYEEWRLEGKLHRVDGPAARKWTIVNGLPILTYEAWWLNGKRHRVDGPACYRYHTAVPKQHWLSRLWKFITRGKEVTPDPVLIHTKWRLHGKRVDPFALPCNRQSTTAHLQRCGLVIWPGLMDLIGEYLA